MGNEITKKINNVRCEKDEKKIVVVLSDEADSFHERIKFLIAEIERLKEENQKLKIYKKIYRKFNLKIHNIFAAVNHLAGRERTVEV